MTLDEVIKYYGSGYNMQKIHGLSHTSLSNRKKYGYIPILMQIKIERLTKGKLKASLNHCPKE